MTTAANLDYDPRDYPPFAVTVDIVVFTIRDDRLQLVLIKRDEAPFKGAWALPGGFVLHDEDLDVAARRELREETRLRLDPTHLAQLKTYGRPGRDPRMRIVTVAWWAIVPGLADPRPGTDAVATRWGDVNGAAQGEIELAFDHRQIVIDALEAARSEIEQTALAASFLSERFRISELRRVYETIWGTKLEPGNFQRKVRGLDGFIEPANAGLSEGSDGRPAELFECPDTGANLAAPFRRPLLRS